MIIKEQFTIIERIDKLAEMHSDQFGYGAIHFIVKFRREASGARYDDLKNLKCEIQVRTVLQDAWAIFAHHLSYKKKSDIPVILQRQINSFAGLFESADYSIEHIRQDREKYIQNINEDMQTNLFADIPFNLDTFTEYLRFKFVKLEVENFNQQLNRIFADIAEIPSISLKLIDSYVNKYQNKIEKVKEVISRDPSYRGIPVEDWSSSLIVGYIIAIGNKGFRKSSHFQEKTKKIIESLEK
jgi:putative GTP pyrophosphokinase